MLGCLDSSWLVASRIVAPVRAARVGTLPWSVLVYARLVAVLRLDRPAAPPREQAGLDDEVDSAAGRVNREIVQLRVTPGRDDEVCHADDDGADTGDSHQPLLAEQCLAADRSGQLCSSTDERPAAEDGEDVGDAPSRRHARQDGCDGTDGCIGQQ